VRLDCSAGVSCATRDLAREYAAAQEREEVPFPTAGGCC
jgi:hypothetical protein